ncbi:lasso RiPP family leader peptide-containing protein [Embleya hyalina]|uniref:Uncharacterized protein n=1 Tax=Embleya hyalina TaxID=516124 RepID=A0A401Z661_9ACTN|nr:lasso RiPP family leader peptide-containing protein [Embleya hyalina]GCE02319.1 hypothetical protein EHYA_10096 [Embleya hyalina]
MSIDKLQYELPQLVEAGDFDQVTMGPRTWGFDYRGKCLFVGC